MRRITRLLIIACLMLVTQAACNLPITLGLTATQTAPPPATTTPPAPGADAPVGSYICNGSENGMLTGIAMFRILPGGVVEEQGWGNETGTWTYDAQAQQFTFSGLRSVDRALHQPGNDFLTFHFLEIPTHASSNDVTCFLEEQP